LSLKSVSVDRTVIGRRLRPQERGRSPAIIIRRQ
jgi:hypothetical protein